MPSYRIIKSGNVYYAQRGSVLKRSWWRAEECYWANLTFDISPENGYCWKRGGGTWFESLEKAEKALQVAMDKELRVAPEFEVVREYV